MEVWDAAPAYTQAVIAGVRQHKFVNYNGVLTTSSTTYVDMGIADIVLAAQVDDVIEFGIAMNVYNSNTDSATMVEPVIVAAGAAVNATPLNTFSGGLTDGTWRQQSGVSFMVQMMGSFMYTVAAGDISSGTITLRLRWRVSSATATMDATATNRRAHVWAKNLGLATP